MCITITSWPMIPSVWIEPSGKVWTVPAVKERPDLFSRKGHRFIFKQQHFQKQWCFVGSLQIQSDPYRRSWGFLLPEKEILSTWMSPSQRLWWFWISVPRLTRDFPGGASGKEPTSQCRRYKRQGFDPWVGAIPWQPTPVFLPRESHGQRSLTGYSPWGSQRAGRHWATNITTATQAE